jgi:hypothetical protein
MVQAAYKPIPRSDGKLELQGSASVFHTASDIVEAAVVGDRYYDPNTEKISSLVGQTEYQNITATGLLSKTQFLQLNNLVKSPKSKDGTLTATHVMGDITTVLTGVRILRISYGAFDKMSNSPAEISIEISFTGTRVT